MDGWMDGWLLVVFSLETGNHSFLYRWTMLVIPPGMCGLRQKRLTTESCQATQSTWSPLPGDARGCVKDETKQSRCARWNQGLIVVVAFHLSPSSNNQPAGQKQECFHSSGLCDGDVEANGNGERLPDGVDRQSFFIFCGNFLPLLADRSEWRKRGF